MNSKTPPSEQDIADIITRLQSPVALADAERTTRSILAAAGRKHAEILRRSMQAARARYLRTDGV